VNRDYGKGGKTNLGGTVKTNSGACFHGGGMGKGYANGGLAFRGGSDQGEPKFEDTSPVAFQDADTLNTERGNAAAASPAPESPLASVPLGAAEGETERYPAPAATLPSAGKNSTDDSPGVAKAKKIIKGTAKAISASAPVLSGKKAGEMPGKVFDASADAKDSKKASTGKTFDASADAKMGKTDPLDAEPDYLLRGIKKGMRWLKGDGAAKADDYSGPVRGGGGLTAGQKKVIDAAQTAKADGGSVKKMADGGKVKKARAA
jgi:hypothetical protein